MALGAERRSLVHAIGLSLALHAAVLALHFPIPTGGQRAAPPIVAHLAPTEPPAVPMASASAKARPATRGGRPTPSAPPPPVPAAEPALDEATAIARYRYELIGTALRYKRYPAEAIASGWEGEVVVRITVTGGGAPEVSVKASSGQSLLDEQALTAFRAAAPLVRLPIPLRGQAFGVEVRAVYSLRD